MPISDAGRRVADLFRPLAALATRVVVGQLFLIAGTGKLRDIDGTAEGFRKLGLTFPSASVFAMFIGVCETFGGALILVGLWTRLGALILSGVMVGALATAHREEALNALVLAPERGKALTDLVPVMVLLLMLWLLAFGGGLFSVDRLLLRRRASQLVVPPT
jgi:putative oxidoreductase